jgi:DNA-binding MarR family transcriptional regulator
VIEQTGTGPDEAGAADGHPALAFDDVVHQRTRLGVLAVLAEVDRADFGYLKSTLGLTDGNLGRHLEVLADAGMITLVKGFEGRRPRTWAAISPRGRKALQAELAQMRALLRKLEASG